MLGGMDEDTQKKMTLAQKEGFDQICKLLSTDMRADFFKSQVVARPANWMKSKSRIDWWNAFSEQLGWTTWQASVNVESVQWLQPVLKSLGVHQTLRYPKDPNMKAEETPRAVRALSLDLTKSLLENREESESIINADAAESTPELQLGIEWAVKNGYLLLVYLMLVRWMDFAAKYKGPVTREIFQNAFVAAAQSHCDWLVKVLLQHDADMDAQDERGVSAFNELVDTGQAKACQILMENGQDPNRNGPQNLRPLSIAATSGHPDVIKVLLDYGAELDYRDGYGFTALHWAVGQRKINAVRMLLSAGADIETRDIDERTPLLSAVVENRVWIVELLLENGADLNACDKNGENALMIAADRGYNDILCLLLTKGPVLDLQNKKGFRAIDLARNKNRTEAIAALEAADRRRA
ncbi:uncharacterized protein PFLUO_LOCUS411 [Penicillium psychrofluorescens]|uniref:uncharacterized protein n=1 Tax=Penicillium psychrofluorescens TaxID=3158075 RepID=UPI003CCDE923